MKRASQAQQDPAARWKIQSECKNLNTDVLSARCIVDRLSLQFGPGTVAQSADRQELKRIVANLLVVLTFVKSVEEQLGGPSVLADERQ
ncbi:MAG TPA: hypothetical protein VF135_09160 [Terriglobales bacterium]